MSYTYNGENKFGINDEDTKKKYAITDVKIENDVTEITPSSFSNFKNLTKINIPKRVKSIGQHAFDNCTELETVEFENDSE